MEHFATIDDILDFAIKKEEESRVFYLNIRAMAIRPEIADVFVTFANEELAHKKRLLGIKSGKSRFPELTDVPDMKIADYTVADEPGQKMAYQDALILAMKKEEASFRLYTDLAKIAKNEELNSIFLHLAQEEAKHKLRFETEYDEHVLKEN